MRVTRRALLAAGTKGADGLVNGCALLCGDELFPGDQLGADLLGYVGLSHITPIQRPVLVASGDERPALGVIELEVDVIRLEASPVPKRELREGCVRRAKMTGRFGGK